MCRTENISLDSVDFDSSLPCDHRQELLWNDGWTRAVQRWIMNCPCNPNGANPFCIHFAYKNGDNFTVTDYLRFIGCSNTLIHKFQTTQIVTSILDTTRRVAVKWNVNPGDCGDLPQSRSILSTLDDQVGRITLPARNKKKIQILLHETRERIWLSVPVDGTIFLTHFWNPVRDDNILRQLFVREKVLKKKMKKQKMPGRSIVTFL